MLHSLLIKLAMLVMAISLVFWLGWRASSEPSIPVVSEDISTTVLVDESATAKSDTSRSDRLTARPVTTKAGVLPLVPRGSAVSGLLDVNRADAKDFESLPGIGPVLAQRVIEYRATVGQFHAIDDLRAVKGIGPKIFERIKPFVTVNVKGKVEKRL